MAGWERELLTVRLECLSAVARGDSHAVRARLQRSGLLLLLPSVQAAAAAAAAATLMPERPASAAHATSLHRRQGLGQEQWQGQEQEEAEEAAAGGSPAARALPHPRVFALSDLHADAAISGGGGGGGGGGEPAAAARRTTYMDLLRRVSLRHFQHDVLLVAGDVADTLPATREALRVLKQRFGRVFFTPGNHDLWLRPGLEDNCAGDGGTGNDSTISGSGSGSGLADSFAKLWALWDACDELGVEVVSAEVAPGVLVAPLLSWYRHTFDTADPVPGRLRFDSWCRWPVAEADVWQVMLRLNDVALAAIRTWRAARRGSTTPPPPNPLPAANAATTLAHHGITAAPASAPLPAAAAPAPADAMPPHRSHGTTADEGCGSSTSTSISSTGNDPALPPLVITLTHFLPHPDLPFPRLPRELAKAVGCAELQHVLAMAGSSVHVYGHSHVAADTWLPTASPAAGAAAADGAVAAGIKGGGGAAAAGGVGSSCGGAASGGGGVGKLHGGRDRTASRRYVHWPLHGQRRAVLRCVWDPARGLCSYGVDGEDGSELS